MINTQSIKSGRARAAIMLDCMQIKVKIIHNQAFTIKTSSTFTYYDGCGTR